jgi:hypothetical protein
LIVSIIAPRYGQIALAVRLNATAAAPVATTARRPVNQPTPRAAIPQPKVSSCQADKADPQ